MLSLWVLSVLQGCASGAAAEEVRGIDKRAYGMEDGPWQIRTLTKNSSGIWTVGDVSFDGIVVDDDDDKGNPSTGPDSNDHSWFEYFSNGLPMMDRDTGWAITVGGTGPTCSDTLKCLKLKVGVDDNWGIGNGHVLNSDISRYKHRTKASYHSVGTYNIYYKIDDANNGENGKGYMKIEKTTTGFKDGFYGSELSFPKKEDDPSNTISWYVIPTATSVSSDTVRHFDEVSIQTNQ